VDKHLAEVSLRALKLRKMPNLNSIAHELMALVTLNLSKNNLFDGDQVFQVRLSTICVMISGSPVCVAGIEQAASAGETQFIGKLSEWCLV
jgi:hypothetical protein